MNPVQKRQDRYESVVKRDFSSAVIRLLENDYEVLRSRRVLQMLAEDIGQLPQEYYPTVDRVQVGDIVWQTTKNDGQRPNYGKKTESYAIQTVILPLIRKDDIDRRTSFKKKDKNSNYKHQ